MNVHTLQLLEYHEILSRIKEHLSTAMSVDSLLELAPSTYSEVILLRHQETREARLLLELDSGMPLGGIRDIRGSIENAVKFIQLTPRELRDVSQTIRSSRRLKTYLLKQAQRCPLLADISRNIPPLTNLDTRIDDAISENCEVRDNASAELSSIRSRQRSLHARLMEKLNSLLASDNRRPMIQEPIITLREGRFCIPVKSECKGQFGGIIHDASASGATVFIEPGGCVELGNDLKELELKEEREVFRILEQLTGLVRERSDDLKRLCEIVVNLDMANARAIYALELDAIEPKFNRNGSIRMHAARHPLLQGDVVPIDIEIGVKCKTLLLTGPNTGGKTVSLKTVGLLTLMAQSGMQVPCAPDSELAIFDQVFADIGDEQDIRQSLSTFSAHLSHIAKILETMGDNALVLLDEIGAGTDPAEGAALAKAILDELMARNARVVATTHYGELKEYAYAHPLVENAAVEFDRETLQPTYHILQGTPGSSHAFYISERLGLPHRIVEGAKKHLSNRDRDSAELLERIERSRKAAREAEDCAKQALREAQKAKEEYQERLNEITEIQRSIRRNASEEARLILRRTSEKAEAILADLRKMNKGARKGPSARKKIVALQEETMENLKAPNPSVEEPIPEGHVYSIGDRVRVTTLNMEGVILGLPNDLEAKVRIGSMHATLPLHILRPVAAKKEEPPKKSEGSDLSLQKAIEISPELSLRAMHLEEAEPILGKYLDDAYAAGLKQARIIHGKGTGALRRFVNDYLKNHPVILSIRAGDTDEGGQGVTVVTFKEN